MKSQNTKALVGMGILTAIVIVLQFVASAIKFGPFSITLVLAPIIIGAALYGWKAGAWLGAVFGMILCWRCGIHTIFTRFYGNQDRGLPPLQKSKPDSALSRF